MKRAVVVLAGLLILFPDLALSQARGQPLQAQRNRARQMEASSEVRATKLEELENWLGRLAGKFRVEGSVELDAWYICGEGCREVPGTRNDGGRMFFTRSTRGAAECARIGTGSGVRCDFNVTWQTQYTFTGWRGSETRTWPEPGTLAPAKMLMGIDHGKLQINYLQVDDRSLAFSMQGAMTNNRASFRTPCMNGPSPMDPNCRRTSWIYASPDGKRIDMGLDITMWGMNHANYRFRLIRLPE